MCSLYILLDNKRPDKVRVDIYIHIYILGNPNQPARQQCALLFCFSVLFKSNRRRELDSLPVRLQSEARYLIYYYLFLFILLVVSHHKKSLKIIQWPSFWDTSEKQNTIIVAEYSQFVVCVQVFGFRQ